MYNNAIEPRKNALDRNSIGSQDERAPVKLNKRATLIRNSQTTTLLQISIQDVPHLIFAFRSATPRTQPCRIGLGLFRDTGLGLGSNFHSSPHARKFSHTLKCLIPAKKTTIQSRAGRRKRGLCCPETFYHTARPACRVVSCRAADKPPAVLGVM